MCWAHDPVTAIGVAAASGEDTDTMASIDGAIVGARHGLAAFRKKWLDALVARPLIEDVLQRVLQTPLKNPLLSSILRVISLATSSQRMVRWSPNDATDQITAAQG
jgi:hypothetical protein